MFDVRPEVAAQPAPHRQRLGAVAGPDGPDLLGDVVVQHVRRDYLVDRRGGKADVAHPLDDHAGQRTRRCDHVSDPQPGREDLRDGRYLVDQARLVADHRRRWGRHRRVVDQLLVGLVEDHRHLSAMLLREVPGDPPQFGPPRGAHYRAGRVVDRNGVEKPHVARPRAEGLQLLGQQVRAQAVAVFRDGQDLPAKALEEIAVDVVHRVGRDHNAAPQHAREGLQQARRPADADYDLPVGQDFFRNPAGCLPTGEQVPPDGVQQRLVALWRPVVQRLVVPLGPGQHGLDRLDDKPPRNGVLVDVADAKVDVHPVAEVRRELRHHPPHRRRRHRRLAIVRK